MHRRALVPIGSFCARGSEQDARNGCVARGSRSVGVGRRGRLARDESSGLCLDLVEGEVDGGEVGSREMGVECSGRVEEGRKVGGDVAGHRRRSPPKTMAPIYLKHT